MKIKLTRSLGTQHALGNLQEHDVHDLEPEAAADLLDKKLAELADDGDEDELHAVEEEGGVRAVPPKRKGRGRQSASTEPPSIDPLSDAISAAVGEVQD